MDSSYEKLKFAREILSTRKTCTNCWYGKTGRCSIQSCDCATQVLNGKENPVWWLSFEDGEERKEKVR